MTTDHEKRAASLLLPGEALPEESPKAPYTITSTAFPGGKALKFKSVKVVRTDQRATDFIVGEHYVDKLTSPWRKECACLLCDMEKEIK